MPNAYSVLGPQFGGGDDRYPKKSLLGFLLPTNTRHVLKFRKDLLRDVAEIGSNRLHFVKTEDHTPYSGGQLIDRAT